ncbi:DUF3618 domain-containing protein [Falsirhodobacter sp. alg1]|uniref:DUF3618 domain-containing protein n=1 Tax=Falsirhodobacter sp. alg1 TaxID=1472418 RepID=UPI0005EF82C1|nr:DUF3618 domain-containing protein [Falsirhodobacter sp. alg1]
MSDTTNPGSKSAHDIEREVDQTRDNISATIEALQDRFSVETIVDNVVQSVTKNGGEVSRNLGRTVRDNPVPLILTGIGLAWMMASNNRSPAQNTASRLDYTPDPRPSYTATPAPVSDTLNPRPVTTGTQTYTGTALNDNTSHDDASGPSMADRAREKLHDLQDAAGNMKDSVKDSATGYGQNASARLDDVRNQAGDHAARLRENALRNGTDFSRQVEKFVKEQPLVVAALGFAAGLGLGGLLPSTKVEDDLMGEHSDAVVASAKEMAGEQMDKAKAVAGAVANEAVSMANEAADAVDEKTPAGEDMVGRVKEEASAATDRLTEAGTRAADEHDTKTF